MRRRLVVILIWLGRTVAVGGAAAAVVLWVTSVWWTFRWNSSYGLPHWCAVDARRGRLVVDMLLTSDDGIRNGFGNPGFTIKPAQAAGLRWWFDWGYAGPSSANPELDVAVPLWFPALALGTLAVWCWCRRLPTKPGCCACGYSLAGLAGATCPECGRAINVKKAKA